MRHSIGPPAIKTDFDYENTVVVVGGAIFQGRIVGGAMRLDSITVIHLAHLGGMTAKISRPENCSKGLAGKRTAKWENPRSPELERTAHDPCHGHRYLEPRFSLRTRLHRVHFLPFMIDLSSSIYLRGRFAPYTRFERVHFLPYMIDLSPSIYLEGRFSRLMKFERVHFLPS